MPGPGSPSHLNRLSLPLWQFAQQPSLRESTAPLRPASVLRNCLGQEKEIMVSRGLPSLSWEMFAPLKSRKGGGPARRERPFTLLGLSLDLKARTCPRILFHCTGSFCTVLRPSSYSGPSIPASQPHHPPPLPPLPGRCQEWQAGVSSSVCKTAAVGSAHLKIAFPRSRQNSWALMEFAEKLISANWQRCQAPPGPTPS